MPSALRSPRVRHNSLALTVEYTFHDSTAFSPIEASSSFILIEAHVVLVKSSMSSSWNSNFLTPLNTP